MLISDDKCFFGNYKWLSELKKILKREMTFWIYVLEQIS